ncbi:UbiA family prenyltransferase, partial [bacterium]|nr:UbiA family prenyltransferase [bacterium]
RIGPALIVGTFAFFYHWGREIIKDIEDIEGDRSQNLKTLPIVCGVKPALTWATVLLVILIGLTLIPYVLRIFSILYLIVVTLGVNVFLVYVMVSMWKRPDSAHLGRLALWMKFDMFFGLLAVYLGR